MWQNLYQEERKDFISFFNLFPTVPPLTCRIIGKSVCVHEKDGFTFVAILSDKDNQIIGFLKHGNGNLLPFILIVESSDIYITKRIDQNSVPLDCIKQLLVNM